MSDGDFYYEDLSRDLVHGHPRRCVMCGAPTRFNRDRCLRHTLWPWQATEGLPPLDIPVDIPGPPLIQPLSDAELDEPLDDVDTEEDTAATAARARAQELAAIRAHADARWLWVLEWRERWQRSGEVTPSRFTPDRRCRVCCAILNENLHDSYYTPTSFGYRCPTHETLPWATAPNKWNGGAA